MKHVHYHLDTAGQKFAAQYSPASPAQHSTYLIHGAIHTDSFNAFLGHQSVQELDMMACGREDQRRLSFLNGFPHQPQQCSNFVFCPATMAALSEVNSSRILKLTSVWWLDILTSGSTD